MAKDTYFQKEFNNLKESLHKPYIAIPKIAGIAQFVVKDVLNAFINSDLKLARSVCERDDLADALNDQVFTYLVFNFTNFMNYLLLFVIISCLSYSYLAHQLSIFIIFPGASMLFFVAITL